MSPIDIDNHSSTIIHIDIDCFYAQVEITKNPSLANVPLGIQQKNIVVTSNYKAREFGIKKCMLLSEAKKLCPNLVLVNGEDLHDYRQISYKVTNLLQRFSPAVERLGLDENFLDVTNMVNEKLKSCTAAEQKPIGHVFGDLSETCDCGCYGRITIGSIIAQEIRNVIKTELNLTTCAGIAHNKMLAKIVGSKHKPNDQTIVYPNSANELMLSLNSITNIPGIGKATSDQLEALGIQTVEQLQNSDLTRLEKLFGTLDKAKTIYNWSYGIDKSAVKSTGKPQSIGLEDSCKTISVEKEVREKLQQLLTRLLQLVNEDGRIPKTLKLTVRKFDKENKISHRETKQCNINPSIFTAANHHNREEKLMTTIMHLFNRIINPRKPYHVTLFGLSFTKFQEPPNAKSSIASFLRKNLEVQSIISIENENVISEEAMSTNAPIPSTSTAAIGPEFESPTPSPKKLKLGNLMVTKKRSFNDFYEDCESPSKLRVADLCLDSIPCPPDADKDVFKELPIEMQKELWDDYKRTKGSGSSNTGSDRIFCGSQIKKSKPNTLLNYFIRNN